MKTIKIVIVFLLVCVSGFAQKTETTTSPYTKQFFLFYHYDMNNRKPIAVENIQRTKKNILTKNVLSTKDSFVKAYKAFAKAPIKISSDPAQQQAFENNMRVINTIFTKNLLIYGNKIFGQTERNFCDYVYEIQTFMDGTYTLERYSDLDLTFDYLDETLGYIFEDFKTK